MQRESDYSSSYSDLLFHRKIGEIIRARSENKEDIRQVIKKALDWTKIASILDLGCGYGWFEEALDGRCTLIAGIDMLEENRESFLKIARPNADEALFIRMRLPAPIALASASFDLVAACYSLYFFPEVLPEVSRLLRPGGTAVVVTHSEAMLGEGEEFFRFRELKKLIRRFSAENGEALLRHYFSSVTVIDYKNSLVFAPQDSRDLSAYIAFKRVFINRDVDTAYVKERLLHELQVRGELRFNKNDTIFLVRR